MSITFYSMSGCHFCDKAKNILKPQIDNGTIVVKPSSQSNGEFKGFPSFKNNQNGRTHSGCPRTFGELKQILDYSENKENYQHNNLQVSDIAEKSCPKKMVPLIIAGVIIVILLTVIVFMAMKK